MDSTGQSLLRLLFNEGESICVSNSQFAYHSIPLKEALDGKITLKSSNEKVPLNYCDSSDLILCSINPINGFRNDSNVTAFRSFLIELDTGSIKDQIATIKHLKIPFSAQVFSGGKSVHTAIVLSEDLKDEKTWRYIAEWILNVVTLSDKLCKNPSRCIRIPGSYREPGKKQRIMSLKTRVTHKELMDWLNRYEHLRPKVFEKRPIQEGEADFSRLSPWARSMLKKGIVFKNGRNQTWYSMAYDFALAGFSEDQTIDALIKFFEEEHDFKEKEFLTAIKSAFKRVFKNR